MTATSRNYALVEAVSRKLGKPLEQVVREQVIDYCDGVEDLFLDAAFLQDCAYEPSAFELLTSLSAQNMTRAARAWWRTEALRMELAHPSRADPLICLRRHTEAEDPQKTFRTVRKMIPAFETVLRKQDLVYALRSRFGQQTQTGTRACAPELCHDRLYAAGELDQVEPPGSEWLSAVVVSPEPDRTVGSIVLPVLLHLAKTGEKVVVQVELLRLLDVRSDRPLRTSPYFVGASVVRVPVLLHYFEGLLRDERRAHLAGAVCPMAYAEMRRHHDADSLLRTLLTRKAMHTDTRDPALLRMANALASVHQRLHRRGGNGRVLVPGRERETSACTAFKENAQYLYRVTTLAMVASRVARGSVNGWAPAITFFGAPSFEQVV